MTLLLMAWGTSIVAVTTIQFFLTTWTLSDIRRRLAIVEREINKWGEI